MRGGLENAPLEVGEWDCSESLWETTGEALLKCESVLEGREPLVAEFLLM